MPMCMLCIKNHERFTPPKLNHKQIAARNVLHPWLQEELKIPEAKYSTCVSFEYPVTVC